MYTCISSGPNGTPPLIGQVRHQQGERSAHLTYFTPESALNLTQVQDLLTELTTFAANRGAFHLLGEAEEDSIIFEQFRRSGFSVYAWQKVWRFSPPGDDYGCDDCRWTVATSDDEADIHWLYAALVPPLVQAANTPPYHPPRGLVYRKGDSLVGFVEVINGIQGIFLEPLIHPEAENVGDLITELINRFPTSTGRPVYVAVRSYQSWLEPFFNESAGDDSPRQALMVKHFTVAQSEVFERSRLVQRAKQTVPLVQHISPHKANASPHRHSTKPLSGTGSEIL
ncbi:MAG: hypothetical protein AB9891_05005 [Anaerolineaceae bacterium]